MQTDCLSIEQHVPVGRSGRDIEDEVHLLGKLVSQIPRNTVFGDSNSCALAVQIDVLRNRLSVEEVRKRYERHQENEYVLLCALFAAEWLYGDTLAPSEDWLIMLYPDCYGNVVN